MLSERVGYEIHMKERPLGIASENNFELVRVRVPDLKQGQVLVRNVWMSVDPYMRGRMSETKSYVPPFELNKPLEGDCIGQIIESKNRQFEVGEYLLSNFGWREYWVSTGSNDISKIAPTIAPLQSYLGIMGRTGLTAYVGLLISELTDSSASNTVFVSAASGAVGSAACQIAKIKGCHVVGSTSSSQKVNWLIDEAGIDYAFDYRKIGEENISSELRKDFSDGIDIYFDNVGGKHLEAALENMKVFGRIALCGMISQYNFPQFPSTVPGPGPSNLFLAISRRIKIQGFIVRDHYHVLNEFRTYMSKWIKEGKIKWEETIYEGLENAPKAFIALFKGEKLGKMLVKI
ncbi:MAG: NADP-dependent oxidoreductase [Nitrososphaeraceae archaeon]|nr:NADP-dependent oxidoreductase [Nitrososphaeraceae archaeon]MDW0331680.1 NADP-dependent oxidoreductase [Nitrososphaeraceae archaeon]